MLEELVLKNRSYRKFHEDIAINMESLRTLVNLARLTASAANRQPLKYILSCDRSRNTLIFPCLAWAGYLPHWPGPSPGERPSAYIILLGDTEIHRSFDFDAGIAAQTILLGATERNLGGCIIASIDRNKLREILNIEARYEILLAIALGKPKETVLIEKMGSGGDVKYWRDSAGVHHVPKRSLEEIILS